MFFEKLSNKQNKVSVILLSPDHFMASLCSPQNPKSFHHQERLTFNSGVLLRTLGFQAISQLSVKLIFNIQIKLLNCAIILSKRVGQPNQAVTGDYDCTIFPFFFFPLYYSKPTPLLALPFSPPQPNYFFFCIIMFSWGCFVR